MQPQFSCEFKVKTLNMFISSAVGLSVSDRVLESTSTKEKMKKYQAAVSKQGNTRAVSSYDRSWINNMIQSDNSIYVISLK